MSWCWLHQGSLHGASYTKGHYPDGSYYYLQFILCYWLSSQQSQDNTKKKVCKSDTEYEDDVDKVLAKSSQQSQQIQQLTRYYQSTTANK
ncbi:hypothetical protein RIR_jg39939.t1 [Rhizophagus irregularis DAOM 181602=DAOM 197198]|uniref:Uncharacterized protein n=2 Tax=Rhizophagus irregularis TaxID=588596 RepID=A0A015KK71_RHIIW|nr:hypothetical protein RirG_109520 [Rhizophagus irregularis DAOM 197198w]GBC14606.1 hypothetical protein RIR_jg39939.t1 [Rhizophagus irregularis DAOM 181602=DAOM 197198]